MRRADWVITGRERHVGGGARRQSAVSDALPAHAGFRLTSATSLPTDGRLGSPKGVTATETPEFEDLQNSTYAAFADMDASPTKAWLVTHRNEPQWKWHYDFAFGKRPAEELYDVRKDPDQVNNLAADPKYAEAKAQLSAQLMKTLTDAKDPRVVENPVRFEHAPYTDVNEAAEAKKAQKQKEKGKGKD